MTASTPFVSVVIPSRDRRDSLGACLRSVCEQDYPRDRYELIVVNDGGAPVDAIVAAAGARVPVRLLTQPHLGAGAARNTGAAAASGALLAFIDDDCVAARDWLACLGARGADQPGALIGGQTTNDLDLDSHATASQLVVSYLYEYFERHATPTRFFTSSNMALSADLFRTLGGFGTANHGAVSEDRELCDRWVHRGYPLIYAPEAVVHHRHAMTFPQFCAQHFRYGRGASLLRHARRRSGRGPLPLEPVHFYTGLLLYPFRRYPFARACRLSALMALTQIAHAAGYAWEECVPGSRLPDRVSE